MSEYMVVLPEDLTESELEAIAAEEGTVTGVQRRTRIGGCHHQGRQTDARDATRIALKERGLLEYVAGGGTTDRPEQLIADLGLDGGERA